MPFRQFGLVLLPALCLLTSCKVRAQGVSITASPMMTEVTARPGAQQTGIITLKHEAAHKTDDAQRAPVRVRVYAMDWTLDPNGNPLFMKAGTGGESCSAWVQLNPVELTISANATAQVRYTLSVPPNVQGTYHTMIMFETEPMPAQMSGQKVAVNGRIGCALYTQVGAPVRRARVTQFAFKDSFLLLNVENTGTTHLRLQGQIELQDAGGHSLAHVTLPGAVVLPGRDNTRAFRLPAPTLPSGVPITMTATLDYGGDALLGARSHVTLP